MVEGFAYFYISIAGEIDIPFLFCAIIGIISSHLSIHVMLFLLSCPCSNAKRSPFRWTHLSIDIIIII